MERARGTATRRMARPGVLCALLTGLLGCQASSFLDETIPTVKLERVDFDQVQVDFNAQTLKLVLELGFQFRNPTGLRIPVPAHDFYLDLDGVKKVLMVSKTAFDVQPNSVHPETYRFELSLRNDPGNPIRPFLGREVPYRFVAALRVPLAALAPATVGSAIEQFTQLTYENELRIPLPPVVALDPLHAKLSLQGTKRTLSLGIIAEILNYDLIESPLEALITKPLVKAAFIVLGASDADADARADEFRAAWDDLKNHPITGQVMTDVRGVRVEVPLRVLNPNEFEIDVPLFSTIARKQNASGPKIAGLRLVPPGVSDDSALTENMGNIAGHAANAPPTVKTLRFVMFFDFSAATSNILDIASGASVVTLLEGEFTVDLGFGPTRIKLDLQPTIDLGP